ncbi:MAG: putative N-acetyl-LL-diaminopimelate aminotransferase [Syntrophorhabdaceae bacterium PtaU1.Bin034]|nr:MAG: putative N-acetyl-LL-diaminopimelate aminotransferase [Syntrophorhabdaceae bacterium PtaU1.Bin034]
MILSSGIKKLVMDQEGWTRKMFEAGIQMKKDYGVENVYDFSLGNPEIEPPPELKDRLVESLNNPVPGMHRYMPNNGYEQVREEIAEFLRERFGLPFTSLHIFMTVGCAGGLNMLFKAMLNRGDEVIVPNPFFWEFKNYIENFGGIPKMVDTKEDFQLDIAGIQRAVTAKTKAVLINSPNNPTGVVYTEESLKELADLLYGERKKGREIYILADEAYRKLVYEDRPLPNLFSIYDLAISVTSHSKDLALPGERIGYIAISPRIPETELLVSGLMIAIRALGFVNAPALFQRVVGEFQRNSVSIANYQQKRDVLYETLMEAGFECVKPTGAFYMFPKSPVEDEVEFVFKMQQEERILVVPGRGFGKKGYFRIAYCVPMDTIMKARPGFLRAGKRYLGR